MTATDAFLFERVSNELDTGDELSAREFCDELSDYGIVDEDEFDDRYAGCFPSVDAFSEDLMDMCGFLNDLPSIIEDSIDYEMMWNRSLRHDYFYIEHNYMKYFFRNV